MIFVKKYMIVVVLVLHTTEKKIIMLWTETIFNPITKYFPICFLTPYK